MSQLATMNPSYNRRTVLVVEDNELNREILTSILEADYNVLTAANGLEGLEMLSRHVSELSLILLDVYMPLCDGFEFLTKISGDKVLSTIPVIVATGSDKREDETKCLRLGAVDFVTKPYNPDVVLSRVYSIIRFRESAVTLSMVERDELTGLYTLEAFNWHVSQAISQNKAGRYTLVVADIHKFKLISSVYGKEKANEALKFIGQMVKHNGKTDICARKDDIFYMFLSGGSPIDASWFAARYPTVFEDGPVPNIQLKIGIYQDIDTLQPVSVLCNRVILASESVKMTMGQSVGFYDDEMHSHLVESHLIEAGFRHALDEHHFQAYYQPKYQPKVDAKTGTVVGAEALVRWIRPDGTMLPPGKFIPLIEKNGQIASLDEYMFREVCLFQKERIEAGKRVVPISINLSRNSIYQQGTLDRYLQIVKEIGIPKELVPIELTESAASEGPAIIRLTRQFADAGFSLHMDDFGTGLSSLSCFTTMPFDVIKIDKTMIDQIGTPKGEVVIEHLIMIAHKIGEQVVAEGVETKEQVEFLRGVNCDVIQGFYFSAPKRRSDFEALLDGE